MLSMFSVEMDPVHETPKRPVLGYFLQETQSCNKSQMFMVVEASLSFREDNFFSSKNRSLPESLPDKFLGFWENLKKQQVQKTKI